MSVIPYLDEDLVSSGALSGLWSAQDFVFENEWRARFDDLVWIGTLQPNWDGEGAEGTSSVLLWSVENLLRRMYKQQEAPPSRIVATPDGTVLIEWQDQHAYRECEVVDPGKVEWFLQGPNGVSITWEDELLLPSEIWVNDWHPEEDSKRYQTASLWEQYPVAA